MSGAAGSGSVGPAAGTDPFRAAFPVLERSVYLNAGTEGPMPRAAAVALSAGIERDLHHGRIGRPYLDAALGAAAELRAGYARALGAPADTVALTDSTTSGINTVLGGLRFAPGDEVLTSDQEHPGLLAPLAGLARRHGVRVRTAPFGAIAAAVTRQTRLVACSHVSWVGGEVVDVPALVASGVPVLLDGAQGLGAVALDVTGMGVDYYAASGQKWLCGPEGSGALYVRPDRLDGLEPPWPGYGTLADPAQGLRSGLAAGAARLDTGFPSVPRSRWALAALAVLEAQGWATLTERAALTAARIATRLAERGLAVAPRGASTLVSFVPPSGDADAEVARLAAAGILVRSIPAAGLVRVSAGAWTSDGDVEALLAAL